MNDFMKHELLYIKECVRIYECNKIDSGISQKLLSMIDNYEITDTKGIVKAHLQQAESLISHAMCLLRMDDE